MRLTDAEVRILQNYCRVALQAFVHSQELFYVQYPELKALGSHTLKTPNGWPLAQVSAEGEEEVRFFIEDLLTNAGKQEDITNLLKNIKQNCVP